MGETEAEQSPGDRRIHVCPVRGAEVNSCVESKGPEGCGVDHIHPDAGVAQTTTGMAGRGGPKSGAQHFSR